MRVPQWLALVIAGAVILYGAYRLYLAVGGPDDEERSKHRRGLYATPRWHHGLVGVLLVLAGGALIATALGWNPLASQPQPPAGQPRSGGREIIITPR
jgi:hypothetical protein